MEDLCNEYNFDDASSYVELRNRTCTRLTMLNGRRGGEPARLMLEDWRQAEKNVWIDQQRLNDLEELDRVLVKSMKIGYMTGKRNNHLVPVLIPPDSMTNVPAIQKLSDPKFNYRQIDSCSPAHNHLTIVLMVGM